MSCGLTPPKMSAIWLARRRNDSTISWPRESVGACQPTSASLRGCRAAGSVMGAPDRRGGQMQLTQRAAARDVQSLLHRLVRNHPPNIGLRNSELLSNFRWCDACLEGGANCILFADCQSYGRQFRPLTFGPRRWRFFTTPLLCHRNYQLLKFLVAEVLHRS
jgi:hypothetical protein